MRSSKKQSEPSTPASGASPARPEPAPEPPELGKALQRWVWQHFGWAGVVVLALGAVWWQWDHVSQLPGIEPLVARLTERSLPKALPGKFNVAIAHLEGDTAMHEVERDVRESLTNFNGVVTLSFDRTIKVEDRNSEQDVTEAHARARALLKASGADALIWGGC